MSKYTTKEMYNFEQYLELQNSGIVNMVSPRVREILGIDENEHKFILTNYSGLLEEYKNLKVVDELLDDAKARVNGGQSKEENLMRDEPSKCNE